MNLQDSVPTIEGDPVQIKQAILKILLNAIEISPSRGSITLATVPKDNNVSIKVEGQGEGIQLAHRDRSLTLSFLPKRKG
jgi:signal transduction histidine kinase